MITRRGFIGAILATACAPAIVRADSLMRIVPRELGVVTIDARYGAPQGIVANLRDDQAALNAEVSRIMNCVSGWLSVDINGQVLYLPVTAAH